MTASPVKVLFVCTANSARSILAEGLLNALGRPGFKAWSAGSHPSGTVNPLALQTLAALGLETGGFRSKDWAEFAAEGAPPLDLVITVCDNAAGEACPLWRGGVVTAHWGVADPAAVSGSDETKRLAFAAAAQVLKRRVELLLTLPLQRLDAQATKRALDDIGRR